jgi:hypothetical protein
VYRSRLIEDQRQQLALTIWAHKGDADLDTSIQMMLDDYHYNVTQAIQNLGVFMNAYT